MSDPLSTDQCVEHSGVRLTFVDSYQSWRPAKCPWCEIARLSKSLRGARDMLAAVVGDMDDGHSFDSLRSKYATALLNARDDATEVLNRG